MEYSDKLSYTLECYALSLGDLDSIPFRTLFQLTKDKAEDEGLAYLDWCLLASEKNDRRKLNGCSFLWVPMAEDNPLKHKFISNPCKSLLGEDEYVSPFRWLDFQEMEDFFVHLRKLDDLDVLDVGMSA